MTEKKKKMITILRELLREVFSYQYNGVSYKKFARVHGYADGFMRALLELEVLSKEELLKIVIEERKRNFDRDFNNECSLMAN